MAFKLNSPLTEDMFNKILEQHGRICIYRFKANEITTSGFSQTIECDYWNVKNTWHKAEMFYNRVPINTSVGDDNQKVNKTPAGILKFVNKMIEDSKEDKTISVIVVNVDALFTLKAKRPSIPAARKVKKTRK